MIAKKNIINILKNPLKIIAFYGGKGYFKWIPDHIYLKILYYTAFNKKLDLDEPVTYNEKIQWLKLYDRNKEYVKLVDKYEVKKIISKKIGDNHIIPTIGIWDHPDEIDWDILPERFVMKTTHDSGGFIICSDKSKINKNEALEKIKKSYSNNYYYAGREWPYKVIQPRIIIEEFKTTKSGESIKDYRFFCFNGQPKFLSVDYNFTNKSAIRRNLYDLDWNLLDAEITYPRDPGTKSNKPENFEKMIEIVEKLCKNIPHVRVDLYNVDGEIYFGEMTFYHQGGFGVIRPIEFAKQMGDWINLPSAKGQ